MADDIDFDIRGDSLQYVEIELDPDETVIAEAGAMLYMTDGIGFEAKMGDGSSDGLMGALLGAAKRAISGETVFLTHFTNEQPGKAQVAFAAPYPGQIVAVDLQAHGGEVLAQKQAFLAAARGTELSIAFNRRIGAGFFGGEGFILQRLRGDGLAFVHAGGTIVERDLAGETLRVDTGCIVAFESTVEYDIEMAGGLRSMLFGGEGLFVATLSGHGRVWLQTMPFARLADRIIENGFTRTGEGD